jgi:hypothetical protein
VCVRGSSGDEESSWRNGRQRGVEEGRAKERQEKGQTREAATETQTKAARDREAPEDIQAPQDETERRPQAKAGCIDQPFAPVASMLSVECELTALCLQRRVIVTSRGYAVGHDRLPAAGTRGATIAVIVCAYNESRQLPACLSSPLAQARAPDEMSMPSPDITAIASRRTALGFVPAETTSNLSPPNDRKRPSALWLRAEFPVQRISTRFVMTRRGPAALEPRHPSLPWATSAPATEREESPRARRPTVRQ